MFCVFEYVIVLSCVFVLLIILLYFGVVVIVAKNASDDNDLFTYVAVIWMILFLFLLMVWVWLSNVYGVLRKNIILFWLFSVLFLLIMMYVMELFLFKVKETYVKYVVFGEVMFVLVCSVFVFFILLYVYRFLSVGFWVMCMEVIWLLWYSMVCWGYVASMFSTISRTIAGTLW